MRKREVLLIILMVLLSGAGCQKIRKVFIKPPPEGITEKSYTIRLMGYRQTVSINATPEELSDFLNDPGKSGELMVSGIAIKGLEQEEVVEPTRTGTTFPINVNLMGFQIPGRLIVVRVVEHKLLWILWDNPYIFQVQRWESTPVKEGTSLYFKFDTEIPSEGILGNMVDALGFMGIADTALKEVDMMLAAIQSYFDPSLDPKQLVAVGLRGEPYDAVMQAHEVQTWVNAPPEDVEAWVTDPDNAEVYLRELKMEKENIIRFQQAPPEEVVHYEAGLQAGAIRTRTDLFGVKRKKGRELTMRLYYTVYGNIGLLELHTRPDAGGTLVTSRMVFEIPGSGSPEAVEIIFFATGLQKLLRERVLMIKQGVEGAG